MTLTFTIHIDQFQKNSVRNISPILFEVGIPNLVCGYILGSQSVAYCLRVPVTLSSGLSSMKIMSRV